MATPLTDAINALTAYANETTGAGDTNLSDAVGTLVDGYGGRGGGGVSLLGEVTIQSNVREYNLDLSAYQNYNFFFVYLDAELTAPDWLYYVKNGTSASGGNYDSSATVHRGICAFQFNPVIANTNVCNGVSSRNSFALNLTDAITNLYIYTYVETKYIKAGSKIKIYGGNYTDM